MKYRALRTILAAGLLPGAAMLAMTVAATATIPANVSVYGSSASAAGVHVVGATSQFSSFAEGAINNRYPLAAVGQESAPASRATASPADYGPLAGTILASDPPQPLCPNPVPGAPCTTIPHQAPVSTYANAQYPNPPGKGTDQYTSGGADRADATATELAAQASGTYSGNAGSPFSNATAQANTIVNPDGSIHAFSHSHVSSANFGAFVIRNVDVVTDAVSAGGKGKASATVNPGVIDQGDGKPQAITFSPQGTVFTIPSSPPVTARVYAVKPTEKTQGDTGSICATGTHVEVDQPSAPGQFSHNIQYILGDACSEAFVKVASDQGAQAPAAISIDSAGNLSGPGSPDSGGTTTTTSFGNPGAVTGFTGAVPSSITRSGRTAAAKAKGRRVAFVAARVPVPLAAIFFLWEALVLGAAASVVWARRAGAVPV